MLLYALIAIIAILGILIGVIIKNKVVKYLLCGILGCLILLSVSVPLFIGTTQRSTEEYYVADSTAMAEKDIEEAEEESYPDESIFYSETGEELTNQELMDAGVAAIQDKDFERGTAYLSRAAGQGHTPSQIRLGNLIYLGWGVPQDYSKAFKWYYKAARSGNDEGQFNVAEMYYYGEGVEASFEQAKQWAEQAADQGHEEAKGLLEKINSNSQSDYWLDCGRHALEDGSDPEKIVHCYRKAAEQGNRDAQYSLGILYLQGGVIGQNDREAEKWLRMALENGDERAREYLDEITPSSRTIAQQNESNRDEIRENHTTQVVASQKNTRQTNNGQQEFEVPYMGGTMKMRFNADGSCDCVTNVPCFMCQGSTNCPVCKGTGTYFHAYFKQLLTCPACLGSTKCKYCQGKGKQVTHKHLAPGEAEAYMQAKREERSESHQDNANNRSNSAPQYMDQKYYTPNMTGKPYPDEWCEKCKQWDQPHKHISKRI